MSKKRRIIISLGGSLVTPNIIDTAFVKQFKTFIDGYVKKGYQFGIVVGGGSTARNYQVAAKKVTKLERDDLDWLGINATRINAHYLRTIFKKNAYAHVVTNPTKKEGFTSPVIVASGWKPGWSTDYVAVELAKTYGADIIINLSYFLVRSERLELSWESHTALNRACLPISARPRYICMRQ